MTPRAAARWLLAALLLGACASRQNPDTQRLPDGSYRVVCKGALTACLNLAEEVCKGGPYEVLTARDERVRYGSEHGSNQGETRSSEARVRCTSELRPLLFGGGDRPPTADPPGPPLPAAAARAPSPPVRACLPGATQACTGPGACAGGHACLPDGSAYGPCDCGTLTSPSNAEPAPPPTGVDPVAPSATSAPGVNSAVNTPAPPKPPAAPPKTPSPSGAATPAPMPRPVP